MTKFMTFNTVLPTGKIGEVSIAVDRIIAIEKSSYTENIRLGKDGPSLRLWRVRCDGGINYDVVHSEDVTMSDFIVSIERRLKE